MTIHARTTGNVRVEDYDALTVDCFDTIFHRQVYEPADLFDHIKSENSFTRQAKEGRARLLDHYNLGTSEPHIGKFCAKYDTRRMLSCNTGSVRNRSWT